MLVTEAPGSSVLLIGVAGGSGSGKTTFSRMLSAHLGDHFAGILELDNYYLDQSSRFDRDGGRVNYDHPSALEFDLLTRHLDELQKGGDIQVPLYDFASHRRLSRTRTFQVKPVVLVDGILILSQESVRSRLDFSVFIDTAEDLRFQRRLARDVRERGRTAEGVHEQFFKQVKPMHDLYVEPSRHHADLVVSGERSFGPVIEKFVYGLMAAGPKSGLNLSL